MVKYSNTDELPHALLMAVKSDAYDRGDSDISVTELIDSPRIRIMKQAYGDQVSFDVAMAAMPLLGTAFHSIMEQEAEPDDIVKEERLYNTEMGWKWSGAIDRIERTHRGTLKLSDWKVCQVHALQYQQDKWVEQLNLYGTLVERTHGEFPELQIVAFLRDWNSTRASKVSTYPQKPIIRVPMPKWPRERREAYLEARMQLHQDAQNLYDATGEIVECSAEDRWLEPTRFAVINSATGNAIKIHDDYHSAMSAHNPQKHHVQAREGEEKRCELYCEFAPMCDQWKDILEERTVKQVTSVLRK